MYLPDKMDDATPALAAGANIIVSAQPPPPPLVNAHRNRVFLLCGAHSPTKNKDDGPEKKPRRPLIFCLLMAASLLVLLVIATILLLSSFGARVPPPVAATFDSVNSANDSFSSTTSKPPQFVDSSTDLPLELYTPETTDKAPPTDHTLTTDGREDSLIGELAEDDASVECQSELKHRKCPAIRPSTGNLSGAIQSESQVALAGHLSGFRPVRYQLNLTIAREQPVAFSGSVDIVLRAVVNTNRIVVHIESSTQIDFGSIRVRRCSGMNICVRSIVHDALSQTVAFELGELVQGSELIRLTIGHFNGKETQGGGIHSHNARPPAWQQGKAWVVGTVFQMRFARKIFPCLDHPALKARLALCLRHPANTEGRSNMPAKYTVALNETNSLETCFEETPSMSTYLFAFAVFDHMSSMTRSIGAESSVNVFFSDHLHQSQFNWVIDEGIFGIQQMQNLTLFAYPLQQLTFVVSSAPYYGIENFGLVTLQAQWIEYPRYEQGHTTLIHEIVHQWIGNLFTVTHWDEICLQEGLTTYIEWTISEELSSIKTPIAIRIYEKRLDSLRKEFIDEPIVRSFGHTDEITSWCFGKPPLAFAMIEHGFGGDVIAKFLREMTENYAWKNANMSQWATAMSVAAGDPAAGLLIERFFSKVGYPVVFAVRTNATVSLRQAIIRGNDIDPNPQEAFVLPLDTIDSDGHEQRLIMQSKESAIPLSSNTSWILVDPNTKTYSRIVYDVHNYVALARCASTATCTLIQNQLQTIFGDFCWALLNDHLPFEEESFDPLIWSQLLAMIRNLGTPTELGREKIRLSHDCSCCVKTPNEAKESTPYQKGCNWTWNDKCVRLRISGLLGRNETIQQRPLRWLSHPRTERQSQPL